VQVTVTVPLGDRITEELVQDTMRPEDFETVELRSMGPVKPFMLVKVAVKLLVDP